MIESVVMVVVFVNLLSLLAIVISVRPPRINSTLDPSRLGLPFEAIELTTRDGVRLAGWWIPQDQADRVIIALHGYPADKGNILPVLASLHRDFNLLFIDFRYFGQSGGATTTAGAREVEDLSAAVAWATERGYTRIGVWGFSMGGAVALMGSARFEAIRAVVAQSSYSDLSRMVERTFRIFWIAKYPLAKLSELWVRLILGVDVSAVSPARSAAILKIPVLVVHSKQDSVIPFEDALRIREALVSNPKAEFWFEDDGVHGELPAGYDARIRDFFLDALR